LTGKNTLCVAAMEFSRCTWAGWKHSAPPRPARQETGSGTVSQNSTAWSQPRRAHPKARRRGGRLATRRGRRSSRRARYRTARRQNRKSHQRTSGLRESRAPVSLERRWSSRSFRYGYLVTTSPQSSTLPSTAASLAG